MINKYIANIFQKEIIVKENVSMWYKDQKIKCVFEYTFVKLILNHDFIKLILKKRDYKEM